jgi:PIN domain nuclease of toxin-antitoxin system
MRLLLDTATFIWALHSPENISARALSAMQADGVMLELSALSITEIAVKSAKGKLDLGADDVLAGLADLRIKVLPWNARHAFQLFDLPRHHGDPFDRQIIAQAFSENTTVVTKDEKFRLYAGLTVIW